MRTRYLSLDAVVLRCREQGEADLWVTLLAPVAGLVSGVAKNALKSQRRFQGALAPGTSEEVLLARRQGVWYLEETVVTDSYLHLKAHPVAYALACYAMESILGSHPDGPAASDAFPLLVELLEHLDLAQADLPLTRVAWDIRFLEALGLAPELLSCVVCGAPAQSPHCRFDGASGGVLCPAHSDEAPAGFGVSPGVPRLLLDLKDARFPSRGETPFRSAERRAARKLLDVHMSHHLPLSLRSKRVLEQVSRVSTRESSS